MFVTRILLCFGCFAVRQHIDGCFSFIHCNIYNWLVSSCILKACEELPCLCFASVTASLSSGFFVSRRVVYLHVSRLIVQSWAWDDRLRRHIRTTNRPSILSRGKQLFFITANAKKIADFLCNLLFLGWTHNTMCWIVWELSHHSSNILLCLCY